MTEYIANYRVAGYASLVIDADSAEEAEEIAREALDTGFVERTDYPVCDEYEVVDFLDVEEL